MLIKTGRIIDPSGDVDTIADLFIQDAQITALGQVPDSADVTIDASGLIVSAGLIDMHSHLREPGNEQAETILSGSSAAVCGGFTAVAAMPNTRPCIDTPEMVRLVLDKAEDALCGVHVVAAITIGRDGQELVDLGALAKAGAVAFSDDGECVPSAELMREAFGLAERLNRAIIQHCEDPVLGRAPLNAGAVAEAVNLPGSSGQTEADIIARDIELLAGSKCRYHVAHVSAAESIELIRNAKRRDLNITAEATPHHLALSDEVCRGLDTVYKVRPPLRDSRDVEAVRAGVADGTIDCLACDHAPHTAQSKARDFASAPAGMIGLETALGVYITELIGPGLLDWPGLIEKLTINPAAVLGLEGPCIAVGSRADITLIDPNREWIVEVDRFRSLGRNCPFAGRKLRGKAVGTIVNGQIRYLDSVASSGTLPENTILE